MKTHKGHLWELVRSMTPAEKRYFKTHFALTAGQLTRLFDVLNAQGRYEPAQAISALDTSPTQYKVLKHQLQALIMKSLIAGSSQRSLRSKVRLGLEEADMLLERGHFDEAVVKLKQLEGICAKYGFTLYQYEVRERLHEIQHLELDFSDPAAKGHYDQLLHLQRILTQKQALSAIQLTLDNWNPFQPGRRKQLLELQQQLRTMQAEHLDFHSMMSWMQSMAVCTELLGDAASARQHRRLIARVFADEPELRHELPLMYLRALKLSADPVGSVLPLDKVNEITSIARRFIAQHPRFLPHYIYFLWARLRAHYMHHQWARIFGSVEQACVEHLQSTIITTSGTAQKIYLTLAVSHLIARHFEQAHQYIKACRTASDGGDLAFDCCVNLLELIALITEQRMDKLQVRKRVFLKKLRSTNADFSPLYVFHLHVLLQMSQRVHEQQDIAAQALLRVAEFPYDPILPYYSFLNIERWLQAVAAKKTWEVTITG
jgi:hypothetical protein